MRRSDVGLGVRLALAGGRESTIRLVVTTAGVVLGVTLLLVAGAIESALQEREGRQAWREPEVSRPEEPGQLLWRPSEDVFDGEEIFRVDVAPHEAAVSAPRFPGLDRFPRPGEVAVSPALAELIAATPADQLGDRFGDGRVTAILDDAVLGEPEELVAVVGWDPADLARESAVGSVETLPDQGSSPPPEPYIAVVFVVGAVALLMPIAVLIATTTRLAAAQREQRLATLRLVGASPGQTRRIAATEGAAVGLVGALGGVGLFALLRPGLGDLPLDPVTGTRFFLADLTPAPALVALVLVATPLVAAAAGVVSLRRLDISPLGVSRRAPAGPPTAKRLVLLALALPVFARVLWYGREHDLSGAAAGWSVGGSFAAIVAGIVVAGPLLVRVTAAWLARHARGAPGLMAARRLADDPRAGYRAIGGVVLAVFVAAMFFGLRPSIVDSDSATSEAGALRTGVLEARTPEPDDLDAVRAAIAATPGAGAPVTSTPYPTILDGEFATVAVVACDDLVRVLDVRPVAGECGDDLVFTADGTDPGEIPLNTIVAAKPEDPDLVPAVTIDPPVGRVGRLAGGDGYFDVLVDPSLMPVDLEGLPLVYVPTDGTVATVERIRTAVVSQVPSTSIRRAEDLDAETRKVVGQLSRAVTLALGATFLIAGCSVAISAVGGVLERRRPFALLRLTGVPLRDLRGVVLREAALPLLTLATTSAVLGLGVAWMIVRYAAGDEGHYRPPSVEVAFTLAASLALALAVVASILPLLGRITSTETTRFE